MNEFLLHAIGVLWMRAVGHFVCAADAAAATYLTGKAS
jgi:hypothetical protein